MISYYSQATQNEITVCIAITVLLSEHLKQFRSQYVKGIVPTSSPSVPTIFQKETIENQMCV